MGITGSVSPQRVPSCQFAQAEEIAEARVDLDLAGEVCGEERPPAVDELDKVVAGELDADLVMGRDALVERAHPSPGKLGPIGGAQIRYGHLDDPRFGQRPSQRGSNLAAGLLEALHQLSQLALDLTLRRHDAPSSRRMPDAGEGGWPAARIIRAA